MDTHTHTHSISGWMYMVWRKKWANRFVLEDRGSGILLTSSSSYPFLFSGGVFYFCHPLYFWWRGTVGRGYIIILKLRGLGDLFLSEGRLIMSERSKVQDKTCYLNGHFRRLGTVESYPPPGDSQPDTTHPARHPQWRSQANRHGYSPPITRCPG